MINQIIFIIEPAQVQCANLNKTYRKNTENLTKQGIKRPLKGYYGSN